MEKRAKCKCKIEFKDKRSLQTILKALQPEMQKPPTFRSRATLEVEGNHLILNVEAMDTVALRAALNAYLRWINSMLNILEFLKTKQVSS
jgi:tRNA threonylcarbamoyladenosine modification (KEOPS) complex  Pcc1 subunit